MTALFYIGFIGACLLVMVAAVLVLRAAESRFPAFKAFLDQHFPDQPDAWR